MNTGTKLALAFIGGAVAGAAALAGLNRGKLDLERVKPLVTDLLCKGLELKDTLMKHADAMREDMEDMAAEARDKADARKPDPAPAAVDTKSAGA